MGGHAENKALIGALRAALYDFSEPAARAALDMVCAPECVFHMCHPLGDSTGPQAFYDLAIAPLARAMPDLERRDFIAMAGTTDKGQDWVGCGGHYMGTLRAPWLDIPPTGHVAAMRFHEFYQITNGKVTEMQAIWDIPELMLQAGAWSMAPALGREWMVPGPATQDGLQMAPYDAALSAQNCAIVVEMLRKMKLHPSTGGPEVMELPRFWHPLMNWYGPSGIGTGRGIQGFRDWHQIPFLNAMPDRGLYAEEIQYHFFGDGAYVGVTGWPNMIQSVTHPGWMGIAAPGIKTTMKSLDFWRLEDGLIRENWVLVDLLDLYDQIGVDPLARMREFNKARVGFDRTTGRALHV